MNAEHEQQYCDVLPSIAAENAALRVKMKQGYDVTSVIRNDIQRGDNYIESIKRSNERYDELIDAKTQEYAKLEETLTILTISREQIKRNTDNLKRQNDLTSIDDEQRRKEEDLVCSNYETMIENRRSIFNSNRLIVRRNHLQNQSEAVRIQSAVLTERRNELERQRKLLREIQNLNLKSVSVELADVWLSNKREKEKIIVLRNKLQDREMFLKELTQKTEQVTPTQRSPRSQFVGLPIPTPSPPIHIPSLRNMEDNELTKYFQKINLFKKGRSPSLLPPVLSRSALRKEKDLLGPPRANSTLIESPAKKITSSISEPIINLEVDKTVTLPPKIIDASEQTHNIVFQPINVPKENTETKVVEPEVISVSEKPNQMYTLPGNHSPKTNSPGKVKSTRLVDKRVSPLTVLRMSPLNVSHHKSPKSRIPVPVSSSSPNRATSRIPRFTPLKANQRNLDKEARRPDFAKKTSPNLDIIIDTSDTCKPKSHSQGGAKRLEVGSPKRGIKYPKMDYAFIQAHGKIHPDESPELQSDQLDNQMSKKLYKENLENIYEEALNENNPMIRLYTDRLKMLREGLVQKKLRKEKQEDDEKNNKTLKNKSDFVESELHEIDAGHFKNIDVSKEKYNEFVKHYEKFLAQDARKNDEREPKDFRDVEKPESEPSVKESISRIDKKEESVKKLNEKGDAPDADYVEYEYEDSFHAIPEMYSDPDERMSKSSVVSNDNRNRSEVFSPFSNGYSFSPPGSNNFSTPFVPMGERGSMFSFGSSVNQLFGTSTTDGTNGQSKNQNNGFFGFNFSSSVDKTDEPFKLF